MTDRTTKADLERQIGIANTLTEETLDLSSWSNGRRRVYSVVEIIENNGERKVSPNGYISEIEYWLRGYIKGMRK